MHIPFLDLKATKQHEIDLEARSALARVIGSGAYILNREVEAFESEWARSCSGLPPERTVARTLWRSRLPLPKLFD